MQDSSSGFFRKPIVQMFILVLLAVVIYSNTFQVPFAFDDETSIIENPVIRSLSNFFSNGSGYVFNPQRFVGYLTLALNYHFGGLNVFGYHVFNLAVHIATTLLVYFLVQLTFRTPVLRTSSLASRSDILALAAALLFVVHPVQTQAVTYIVQRLASLATLFYLSALVLHIRWRLASESGESFLSFSVLPIFLCSLAAALLAMKSKEIAFTLPLVILLSEFCFFGRPNLRRLCSLVPMLLTVAIIPLSMIGINKPTGEILSDVDKMTTVGTTLPRWEYLCTQFNVIITYLRLLFLPIGQNLDYDFPVSHSVFEQRTLLSLLMLLTLFAAASLLWRRSFRGGDSSLRLAVFGILWFFITLTVESSVIPITDVIFEHRLYLPSVGFFIALVILSVVGMQRLIRYLPVAAIFQVPLLVIIVILLSGTTYARNIVWQDGLSLWKDAMAKSPNKARPMNNLGHEFNKLKRYYEAEKLLLQAVNITPDYIEAHVNLGIALAGKGDPDAAIKEYQTALQLNPDFAKTHNNLGVALIDKEEWDSAIKELKAALRINPNYSNAHNNLGFALYSKGDLDGAIYEYKEALSINPDFAKAHDNLGLVHGIKGDLDSAIKEIQEALRLDPYYADAHDHLGFALAGKGNLDAAIKEFQESLRLRPNSTNTHNFLGIIFASKGDLDAAIKEYQEALRILPGNAKAKEGLEVALARKQTQREARK